MLTVEIKINESLIGFIRIHNINQIKGNTYEDEVEYYNFNTGLRKVIKITHDREKMALNLIEKSIKKLK